MNMDNWKIEEKEFDARLLNQRETVFTIGNGYLGTRGSFEEGYPGEQPVTLINGVYDDIPIAVTELANSPDWTRMYLLAGGQRFNQHTARISQYHRVLDMHTAALSRSLRWEIEPGAALELTVERFASLADEHVCAVRWSVRSDGYTGRIEFRAGLSGQTATQGFLHWVALDQGALNRTSAYLHLRTLASRIELAEAFSLAVTGRRTRYTYWDSTSMPEMVGSVEIRPGETVTAEKLVAIYTSRDVSQPLEAAREKIRTLQKIGYARLMAANRAAWDQEWQRCDVTIEGNDQADQAVRYNLFGLLIAAPRRDQRVSIPAKSLSGYGYHGHIFWDTDIFILPFFTFTSPHIARNLLMYRYHTLPAARRKAAGMGYEGALYAWESAATGAETTPRWVVGPEGAELIRIWCGDIEHHISADVAYGVYQYWRVTGDDAFLRDYGAEILLATAKFWVSRVRWDEGKQKYVILDVIGPDENHEHVDNNVYTNLLARWNILTALSVLDWLVQHHPDRAAELQEQLNLPADAKQRWREVAEQIFTGYHPQTRLFEQFEGFFRLEDPGLQSFEPRTRSVQAILGVQPAQKVQIIKQPDVLMLLHLLEPEYDLDIHQANWDYYTPRTDLAYGSSLGPAIQAVIAARMGRLEDAYTHFLHAALTDLEDVRGNSIDGFHAATAGGVWQAVVLGFGRVDPIGEGSVRPKVLPDCFTRLRFRLQIRGQAQEFDLTSPPVEPETGGCGEENPSLPVLGAIFDLDGVLTDTSELHYLAWKRIADEEGIPFDREMNEALRGIPRRESLLKLLNGRVLPEDRLEELMERKNRYYLESVEALGPNDLLPGARAFLEDLQRRGIRIAIGSASKNAALVIDHLGIVDLVQAVSDGYSVERQKPAPDLFLHAAKQIGLPPGQCVVFEDAAAGVEAARAGGMWAVGIGPRERVGAADVVIPDLSRVSWDDILTQLERVEPQIE